MFELGIRAARPRGRAKHPGLILFREYVDVVNLVKKNLLVLHRLAVSIKPQPLVQNGLTVAEHDLAILHRVDVLPVAY